MTAGAANPDPTQSPQGPTDPRAIARRHLAHPRQIGPYRILEELGEGGMGVVYLAEQTSPIHRRVALKVIKLGMDTRQVIARFEAEREALALMNHANVASVYDAGATDEGRPYFAMEYVPGVSITEYCDAHRLSTDDRLRLFIDVCHAVEHAHQKGIIHRDLKPSNVLVTSQGDRAIVKVIDFGVAKATQPRLGERTVFTEHGQLLGTPGHMSPEQASMTALDIDTRTDIYALGVLMYQLLVGSRPFDDCPLREADTLEIQRVIREVDPPRPSARLAVLSDDAAAALARKRSTEPRRLERTVRGELDWLVMKCLEKDRTRRYATANALAQEVERYLQGDPVLVGPPSRAYRLGKLLRKHRGPVAALAAIFLLLTGGLLVSTAMYRRSERQRLRADVEARTAASVKDFLVDLFRLSDPDETQGNKFTVREALDRGADRVVAELGEQPAVQAALMQTIGNVYKNVGLFDKARTLLESSLRIYQAHSADELVLAEARHDLALVVYMKGEYEHAVRLHREALATRRLRLGEAHPEVAESLTDLATALEACGVLDEAGRLHRQALDIRRTLFGAEHASVADSLLTLGRMAHYADRLDEAEQFYRGGWQMLEKLLGPNDPQTIAAAQSLATAYRDQQRSQDAERLFGQLLDQCRRVYEPDHPSIAFCLCELGALLTKAGRFDEAEPYVREALQISEKSLSRDSLQASSALKTLGDIHCARGDFEGAVSFYSECIAVRRKRLAEPHGHTAAAHAALGACLTQARRYEEARTELTEALRIYRAAVGDGHRYTTACVERLVELYEAWGRTDDAQRYREMLAQSGSSPAPP